jgi:hypothetical protein
MRKPVEVMRLSFIVIRAAKNPYTPWFRLLSKRQLSIWTRAKLFASNPIVKLRTVRFLNVTVRPAGKSTRIPMPFCLVVFPPVGSPCSTASMLASTPGAASICRCPTLGVICVGVITSCSAKRPDLTIMIRPFKLAPVPAAAPVPGPIAAFIVPKIRSAPSVSSAVPMRPSPSKSPHVPIWTIVVPGTGLSQLPSTNTGWLAEARSPLKRVTPAITNSNTNKHTDHLGG